ncbi:hypothetical protein L4C36_21315 [Photobacterium japonica]|uniref:hypothetical protein n=1 Tax=Photobacterium japonica TaxID=2910235 RepID=UPI003D0A08CC
MSFLFSILFLIYLLIGTLVTLGLLVLQVWRGVMLFDMSENGETPFRYKVSYFLVMNSLFPLFYIVFIQEIGDVIKSFKSTHYGQTTRLAKQ